MWKIVIAILLGLRHGIAPDHVAALNSFIRMRKARPRLAWSYAWRLGGGHLSGMLAVFGILIAVIHSISRTIIHSMTFISGIWLMIVAIPLIWAIWSDNQSHWKWTNRLTTLKASWLVGIVLGIAISPGDMALYLLVFSSSVSNIGMIWLLAFFFLAMLLSLTLTATFLSATYHDFFRPIWKVLSGVSGVFSLVLGVSICLTAFPTFH
ncbi:MAG: hypothetical protein M1493_13010 [Firmicutes bacterium]|nr:hypothetical protein [Bacillota bacterium]